MYTFTKKIFILLLSAFVALDPLLLASAVAQEAYPSPESLMITEPVTAVTQAESVVNTTLIDSNLETEVIPITEESNEPIVPFSLESPAPSALPSPVATESATVIPAMTNLEIENNAIVETQSTAIAESGDNTQVAASDTTMVTGDAAAIATNLSLTNTTLVNSDLQVGVMVVLRDWGGDLVLDPVHDQIDNFKPSNMTFADVEINNSDTSVTTTTTAIANTGDNTQIASGSGELVTGQAMAVAQNSVIVNTSVINGDVFQFLPENIWLWSGRILNWEYPGSISAASSLSNLGNVPQNSSCNSSCSINIKVNNSADVTTQSTAIASTGGNYQESDNNASMTTGGANAIALNTTMVNTTLIDSRYRLLSMLLLAPWTGNLVFAYPDIELLIKAPEQVMEGDDIPYEITINNLGYGIAQNLKIDNIVKHDNSVVFEKNESIETLIGGESVVRKFNFNTTGQAGKNIVLSAGVMNSIAETSLSNNSAIIETQVIARPISTAQNNDGKQAKSSEVPHLRLISKNNINEYVYPGDGITYDMTVYNDGPINAKNIVLFQYLYSESDELIGEFGGKVGDLDLNKGKNVRFVLNTPPFIPGGEYYTESYISGHSDQGATTYSNTVRNTIVLKAKAQAGWYMDPQATATSSASGNDQQVLGVMANMSNCENCVSFPWYVAISLGSLAYYLVCARRKDYLEAIKWGLALPLSAYAGLVYSNPGCSEGIVMLPSSGSSCVWFLPIALGIFTLVMGSGRLIHNISMSQVEDYHYLE